VRSRFSLWTHLLVTCALVTTAAGCGSDTEARKTTPTTRPAKLHACAPWKLGPAFDDYTVTNSNLSAISKTQLGRDSTFRHGATTLRLSSGVNVEDELEDWDLNEREVDHGGRSIELLDSAVNPNMLLALWEQPGIDGICANYTLVAHGLPVEQLLALVDNVH
jgi:hypothetical protein